LAENNDEKLSKTILLKKELHAQTHFQAKRATSDVVERSDVINREFEKVIEFVNILDEVDNFIHDSTKNIIRKLNAVYDMTENRRYRKSHCKS
jgi:hypothetical protein